MKVELDRIGQEPFRWREVRQLQASVLERPEVLSLGEVSWAGEVGRCPNGFRFHAELAYEQTLTCQRCLAPATGPVGVEIDLMLIPSSEEPAVGEHALEQEDLNIHYVDEVLDTEPILLEQMQLNVPMRALCREDCAGLCPICGSDRNLEECSCERSAIDPRWSVLRSLRDGLEE